MTRGVKTAILMGAFVAMAAVSRPAEASGPDAPIWRRVDAGTGAEVRIYRGSGLDTAVEVVNPHVAIRRALVGRISETAIRTPADAISLRTDGRTLTIAGRGGTLRTSLANAADFERVRDRLRRSAAFAAGLDLLARLDRDARSPEMHLLMSTRATLLSLLNDESGRREYVRWVQRTPTPRTVRVVDDEMLLEGEKTWTASECWAEYQKEAIATALDYEECVKDLEWYHVIEREGCRLVYELRAMAAFAWWIKCVSFK